MDTPLSQGVGQGAKCLVSKVRNPVSESQALQKKDCKSVLFLVKYSKAGFEDRLKKKESEWIRSGQPLWGWLRRGLSRSP